MAKKKHIGAILTLKDNMSATLKGIRKEQSAFKKDVENTRKTLEKTYKKKYTMRLNNTAAMKKIRSTRKALDPLRKRVVVATAYKDMITSKVRKTQNRLKALGKRTIAPVVKIKDKTTAFFSKMRNKLFNLKSLFGGIAIGAGIGKTVGSGAELERQMISMEHFIGINNKSLDISGVKKATDNYIGDLRELANVSPFTSSELIQAGTRALGVTGDTSSAMELVKVAQDMAALTPGKTVMDAMEALADARNGEMERLKEFNAKVSAEEFEALGFEGVVEKKLKSQFEGGAAKLSKSASGLWATIKGKLGTTVQDLGLSILDRLKPHLESVIAWLDRSGPTIERWAGWIGTGIGWVIDKVASFVGKVREYIPVVREVVGNVASWISEKFGWIKEEVGGLNINWGAAWEGIKSVISTAWEVIEPVLSLIADAVRILWEAFEWAFPKIQKVVESVWKVVRPILEKLGDVIGWIGDKVGKLANWISNKNEKKKSGSGLTAIHGSHASGLARVPFDGYIAELHKNEAVIPAEQNPFIKNNTINNTKSEKPITVNIYGVNKSTDEIVNEMVTKIKLALANM